MAGKVKQLLEDIAHKVDANKCSPFCVGDSLTIADIQVGYFVCNVCPGRGRDRGLEDFLDIEPKKDVRRRDELFRE